MCGKAHPGSVGGLREGNRARSVTGNMLGRVRWVATFVSDVARLVISPTTAKANPNVSTVGSRAIWPGHAQ